MKKKIIIFFLAASISLVSCDVLSAEKITAGADLQTEVALLRSAMENFTKVIKDNNTGSKLRAVALLVGIGGGSCLAFYYLRKQWATPEDLDKTTKRIEDSIDENVQKLNENTNAMTISFGQNLTRVEQGIQALDQKTGAFNTKIQSKLKNNLNQTEMMHSELKNKRTSYTVTIDKNHQELLQRMGLAGVACENELMKLGINCVSNKVKNLSTMVSYHLDDMNQNMNLQKELSNQQHKELMSAMESLTQNVPEVQQLVKKNENNLNTILQEIQELKEASKNQNEISANVTQNHKKILERLSNQEKEQNNMLDDLIKAHRKFDSYMNTLAKQQLQNTKSNYLLN